MLRKSEGTVGFYTVPGRALRVSYAEFIGRVEALLAPTDPVAGGRALLLHLLVLIADVVAVEAPGQVVPQLGEVVLRARRALGGRAGRAVRGHVLAGGTHVADEGFAGGRVPAHVGLGGYVGGGGPARGEGEQDERQQGELWRKMTSGNQASCSLLSLPRSYIPPAACSYSLICA